MEQFRDRLNEKENRDRGLTRRDLLQRIAWVTAAAALPVKFAFGAVSPAMEKLSTYMSEGANRALPDQVTEATKQHVLDTFAAMVSGSQLPAGLAAIRFAKANQGDNSAMVVCSKILCGPMEAALANAELAHADETDDSHAPSLSHPGCSVVPAALAAGERFRISGEHFLRAVALGYDVGPRVTMTLGIKNLDRQHRDSHSIVAVFGSAAAAACAAKLNAQQMRWVLDYAAQQCAGINALYRDTEHIEKAFVFAGVGARGGVTAALVVQEGWTGIDDIMSGDDNFLMAYAPQADPANLVDKLGERWEITRTNIKKWSVGSPIQAPLDALQDLMKQHPLDPDQVQKIVVRLGEGVDVVDNRDMPDICLQHMMAVMLIDKTASFHAAHDKERMKDPAVLRQRAKVQLVLDEGLEKAVPRREATVEVTLTDGTVYTDQVLGVRGTVENPMTREEVVAKFNDLAVPVMGKTTCAKLVDKVMSLDQVKDIRELRPLLQRASSAS